VENTLQRVSNMSPGVMRVLQISLWASE